MKNYKGSKLKRMLSSFKNELKESVGASILSYIVLFIFLSLIGLIGISYVIGEDIVTILKKNEVLAVVVIALPTVIVWIFDINNKNILNKSERFNMYLKIQESLVNKYNSLKNELNKIDNKENVQMIFNQLDKLEKFIDDLESLKKYTDIESSFYQIDLFYFFDKVNIFEKVIKNNEIENKAIDKKIGKVQGRIIKYFLSNSLEDILTEKLYLFTETRIFKNIDFRNLGDLSNLTFEGSPTFRFENCKIDLNNFSGFLENNIELQVIDCEFYDGDKYSSYNVDKDSLREEYNITVKEKKEETKENYNKAEELTEDTKENDGKDEELIEESKENDDKGEKPNENTEESVLKFQKDDKNRKEKCKDINVKFIDNRSNIALSLTGIKYFTLKQKSDNYNNKKIVKHVLKEQIEEELAGKGMDNKDILIRYSKDYSDKPVLNGKVKWQSWHSIDLPVYDPDIEKNRLKSDSIVIIQSGYAFVTEKDKDKIFHILFFTKEEFENLLKAKIEKNAYTVYKNAQQKYYVKFNFYFAELVDEISVQDK